jgi:hypothetical protein
MMTDIEFAVLFLGFMTVTGVLLAVSALISVRKDDWRSVELEPSTASSWEAITNDWDVDSLTRSHNLIDAG